MTQGRRAQSERAERAAVVELDVRQQETITMLSPELKDSQKKAA